MTSARPALVARWLFVVAGMIVAIVVVGGITRLTESGLSITEWKPLTGVIPPLTQEQWVAEFANYKRIPEYQELNRGMTLAGFKAIFFWEYIHRLLARTIGMVFALPLIWFTVRRQLPTGYGARLCALLGLGALQGAIGWWMVQSGLSERTDVSHLRLALHLTTALVTLGGIVWTALDLRTLAHNPTARPARLPALPGVIILLLFVQIVWGAFTAGLDAGYAFASWPLMGDHLFPADVPMASPMLSNLVDNPVVVQFIHRWLAIATGIALIALAVAARRHGAVRTGSGLVVLTGLQVALGIATLLSGVALPVAVAHQANAALLVVLSVTAAHAIGRVARV